MRTGTSFQAIRTRARFSSGAYAAKTLAHIGPAAECLAALSNRAEPPFECRRHKHKQSHERVGVTQTIKASEPIEIVFVGQNTKKAPRKLSRQCYKVPVYTIRFGAVRWALMWIDLES